MIIDIHVHPIFQDMIQEFSSTPEGARTIENIELTSRRYYDRSPRILSLTDFQKEMATAGIDKVGLVLPGQKGVPARLANEQLSTLLQMLPDKLIGFAGFDPNQDDEAVVDIQHAVEELGFKGIKTVSSELELDINDKSFYPCYAAAQELDVPIIIHTGPALITGALIKHVQPLMVDDVAFDFPDLKIICAHMGGHHYMEVHNLLVRHPNVYADLSFWPLHPFYKDMIPWSLFEKTVPDKILLGSDYPPGQTPAEAVEAVRSLPIGEDFMRMILGENAARLLSL
jgi:predicted TIM-barrel fold metal-dependent hydrolase